MKSKNKIILAVSIVIVLLLLIIAGYLLSVDNSNGRKICPDSWTEHVFPTSSIVGKDGYPQEFVVDGKKIDPETVDRDWVRRSCKINEPTPIYN